MCAQWLGIVTCQMCRSQVDGGEITVKRHEPAGNNLMTFARVIAAKILTDAQKVAGVILLTFSWHSPDQCYDRCCDACCDLVTTLS